MSKYTVQLRWIVEQALHNVGRANIEINWKSAYTQLGLNDYPIFDETHREILNNKIIRHYYFREIGFETVEQFRFMLRRTMHEIMPYYNKLYESELLVTEPMFSKNMDYTEKWTRDEIINAITNDVINTLDNESWTRNEKIDGATTDKSNETRDNIWSKDESIVDHGERSGNEIVDKDTTNSSTKTTDNTTNATDTSTETITNNLTNTTTVTPGVTETTTETDLTRTKTTEQPNAQIKTAQHLDTSTTTNNRRIFEDTPMNMLGSNTTSGGTSQADGANAVKSLKYATDVTYEDTDVKETGDPYTVQGGVAGAGDNVTLVEGLGGTNTTVKTPSGSNKTVENKTGTVKNDGSKTSKETFSGNISDKGAGTEDTQTIKSETSTDRTIGEYDGTDKTITDATKNGTTETTGAYDGTNQATGKRLDDKKQNTKGDYDGTRARNEKGYDKPQAELLLTLRETFLNIDLEIIERLNDLFILIW